MELWGSGGVSDCTVPYWDIEDTVTISHYSESQFPIEKLDNLYLEQVPQVISMNRQIREALM